MFATVFLQTIHCPFAIAPFSLARRSAALLAASAVLLAGGCERSADRGAGADGHATSRRAPVAAALQPGPTPITARAHEASDAAAPSPERGRYIVLVGGCNDCHTPGFMEKGTAVPESQWLTGVPVGWKGPWGTTYASNLRLFLKDFEEDTFVQVVRARNSRPPMPWPNLHAMSDTDLRSVFQYVRNLKVTGDRMPEYVPPGKEPQTAYVEMSPQMPKTRAAVD